VPVPVQVVTPLGIDVTSRGWHCFMMTVRRVDVCPLVGRVAQRD